jgi:hypothetical protein
MQPSDRSLLRLMDRLDTAGLSGLMPTLLEHLGPVVGAVGVRLLIADVEARRLEARDGLGHGATPRSQDIEIHGSVHGSAYLDGRPVATTIDEHPSVLVPVTARRERHGVLEVMLEADATPEAVEVVECVGVLLGYLVTAGDLWTDEFHFARRRRPMTLAAEIQWGLLPLAAFSAREISIAGAMEPAYEVGGDTFDYACGADEMTVGIFDAMGHGLTAARLSSLCVATFRNARRAGRPIHEQADAIHETMAPAFQREGYATGAILRIDLRAPEETTVMNAGHEQPFLLRRGAEPEQVTLRPDIPFGMPFQSDRRPQPLPLQPGDRLALFTDGVIEARPDGGEMLGLEALAELLQRTRRRPPREAARVVTQSVRNHRAAHLQDDATIVVVDIPG